MKTCPTCQAVAFDDAEVCYGCLHRYSEQEETPALPSPAPSPMPSPVASSETPSSSLQPTSFSTPPGFTIKMMPAADATGIIRWDCSVELLA